jgi:hypothetical protein
MKTGLLWHDDSSSRDLTEKVNRAVMCYEKKHGEKPNVCYVHPSAIEKETEVGGVMVKPLRTVLRHHFWVGIEDERKTP